MAKRQRETPGLVWGDLSILNQGVKRIKLITKQSSLLSESNSEIDFFRPLPNANADHSSSFLHSQPPPPPPPPSYRTHIFEDASVPEVTTTFPFQHPTTNTRAQCPTTTTTTTQHLGLPIPMFSLDADMSNETVLRPPVIVHFFVHFFARLLTY